MKFFKKILTSLLIIVSFMLCVGCYFINAQTMKDVRGTYKLTAYTRTYSNPSEGQSIDYIKDNGWEAYLIVTGSSEGWFAMKTSETAAYAKQVTLSYEYDLEETSKVRYVFYQDSVSSDKTRLGVQEDKLTHSTPSVDLGILQRPYSISMTFEKVDDATDLTYAKKKLGEMPTYSKGAYRQQGLYYLQEYGTAEDAAHTPEYESQYIYFYFALDTGAEKATVYYALKSDCQQRQEEVDVKPIGDWEGMEIDGVDWTPEWIGATSVVHTFAPTEEVPYTVTQKLHLWWREYTKEELETQLQADLDAYLDSVEENGGDSSGTEIEGERYAVTFNADPDWLYEELESSYVAGETVVVKIDIAYDLGFMFFVNGEEIRHYDDVDGAWVFKFTMPEEDVVIDFKTYNGFIIYEYEDELITTYYRLHLDAKYVWVTAYYEDYASGAVVAILETGDYDTAIGRETIGGFEFIYPDSNRITVLYNEQFYTLSEALEAGYLTQSDLETVHGLHREKYLYLYDE